jgi:drug/metabolite transporter (DMT)-like permease
MRPRAGYLEIAACTLTWGTIGPIVKRIGLDSSVIVFFRLFLGALVVFGWTIARGRAAELRPRARPVLLIAWGVALAVHWLFLFAAFKRLDVATTILVVFLGPVLMALLAPAIIGERLRLPALGALAVAVAGIALIATGGARRIDGRGLLFAIASAVLFAVLPLMGKLLTPSYEPGALVAWQLGIAAIVVSPALAGAHAHAIVRAWPLLLLLGGLYTGVLGILYVRAIARLRAQTLGVLFYLEPASAVLYAWWFLGERPNAAQVAGGALVVIAGLAIILGDRAVAAPAAFPEPIQERR